MRDELSQKELDEIFYGPSPRIQARFYDEEVLDVMGSREAGHRVNKKMAYLEVSCERENAHMIRPKQDADEMLYPREWQAYQQEKSENERHRQVSDACDKTVRIGEALAKAQAG